MQLRPPRLYIKASSLEEGRFYLAYCSHPGNLFASAPVHAKCLSSVLGVQREIGTARRIPYLWLNHLGKVQLLGTAESSWLLASCSNCSLSAGNHDGAHARGHATLMHAVLPTTHRACTKLIPNTMTPGQRFVFRIIIKSGSSPSQTSSPFYFSFLLHFTSIPNRHHHNSGYTHMPTFRLAQLRSSHTSAPSRSSPHHMLPVLAPLHRLHFQLVPRPSHARRLSAPRRVQHTLWQHGLSTLRLVAMAI